MTLKEHIDDICNNLVKQVFTSEALVSEGIVRRLLDALWLAKVYDIHWLSFLNTP